VIVTCPELLVVPLEGRRLPAFAIQLTVFPATGLPPEVSVAVKVVISPGCRERLEGVIARIVEAISII
jgi:hypothetical protein